MTLTQPPAKTGIFAGFSFGTPFPERMRMVQAAGFDATALWWDDRHPRAKEMREIAPGIVRDAGLDIDHVHAPFQRSAAFWSADDEERLAVVEEYRHYIQTCARFGVPRMVMHVTTGASTPPPGEPGLDTFRRLLDEAEAHGVTIAIENTRLPGHVDYLLTHLPHPRLGLCHDTSHARLYADDEHDLIERAIGLLAGAALPTRQAAPIARGPLAQPSEPAPEPQV